MGKISYNKHDEDWLLGLTNAALTHSGTLSLALFKTSDSGSIPSVQYFLVTSFQRQEPRNWG